MKKIIFIYNANSSLFSTITDTIHKTVSPATYQCNLCRITYGTLTMKKDWQNFIASLPYEVEFLHKDQVAKKYPQIKTFPVILFHDQEAIKILIPTDKINQAATIEDLKILITNSLKNL